MYVSVLDPKKIANGKSKGKKITNGKWKGKCKVAECCNSSEGDSDQEVLRGQVHQTKEVGTPAALTSRKMHGIGTGHFWNANPT